MTMKQQMQRVRRRLGKRHIPALPPARRLDQREDLKDCDIGRFTWGHLTVSNRTPGASLTVGQFCSFAYGCSIILGGEHRTDFVSTYRFPHYEPFRQTYGHLAADTVFAKGDVVIGNDVWVGHQALIVSGVTIADGVVVGAGSVVRGDVPAYAIVAGNPARVAGFRFPKEQIEALLEIQWWDWPLDRISDAVPLLMSQDIQAFIDANT